MRLPILFSSLILAGCVQTAAPPTMPIPSPDMMTPPCKLESPVSDADEDLAIDVRNAECTRQLRLKVYRLQGYIRNILE